MAKDPAFLFYPNDWIGGTMGMTFEEKGAYMELLMMQFNRGHMTEHMIGQIVGQLWLNIKDKFTIDNDGKYFNIRLEEEQNKRKAFTESRRNNIKGENQYSKKRGHTTKHMTEHMENENVIEIKDRIKILCNGNSKKVFQSFEKWKDYLFKQHNVTLQENQYTYQILESKIKEIGVNNIVQAIEFSIESNYKKIYPKKEQQNSDKPTPPAR